MHAQAIGDKTSVTGVLSLPHFDFLCVLSEYIYTQDEMKSNFVLYKYYQETF